MNFCSFYPSHSLLLIFFSLFIFCNASATTPPIWEQEKAKSIVLISGYLKTSSVQEKPFSQSSGFIIDSKGTVFTTYDRFVNSEHRLLCDKFIVQLHDGKRMTAKMVAVDAILNLAILQLENPHNYPSLSAHTTGSIQAGDKVFAMNAEDATLIPGVVKEKNRTTLYNTGLGDMLINIKIDMPSLALGGPLFDNSGRLIAINTANIHENLAAVVTNEEQHALPMNIIMTFYKVLMAYPTFELPWLGFSYRNLTVEEHNLLRDNKQIAKGLVITFIWKDGIAASHDLKIDDIILSINGNTFNNRYDLDKYLFKMGSGKEMNISLFRAGKVIKIQALSETRPTWAAP